MTDREERIIEAAFSVFSRYGVKRSSMSDIAAEADVARQTLYNAFSSKDDVLIATIRLFTDRATADIAAGLDKTSDLGEQLDLVFKHVAVVPFDLLATSPNTEDIIAGFNASGQAEIAKTDERFRVLIERVLKPHEAAITAAGLTAGDLSDLVQRSAAAAKHQARNRKHLLRLLKTLKTVVMRIAAVP